MFIYWSGINKHIGMYVTARNVAYMRDHLFEIDLLVSDYNFGLVG